MTTRQLLEELGVPESRLRHAIRRGDLRPQRLGPIYYWSEAEVEKAKCLLRTCRQCGRGPTPAEAAT